MRKTFEINDRRFVVNGPIGPSMELIKRLKKWKGNISKKAPETLPGTSYAMMELSKEKIKPKSSKLATLIIPFSMNVKDLTGKIPKSWIRGLDGSMGRCRVYHRGMYKGTINVKSIDTNTVSCDELKKQKIPIYVRGVHS
jgi:hypothetical protein